MTSVGAPGPGEAAAGAAQTLAGGLVDAWWTRFDCGRGLHARLAREALVSAVSDLLLAVLAASAEPTCRMCGCTDSTACQDPTTGGPCGWAEPDLCTACDIGPVCEHGTLGLCGECADLELERAGSGGAEEVPVRRDQEGEA